MGDVSFRSFEKLAEQSMVYLNEQINKVDWNKRWQASYPKTERAQQELDTLKKPDVKEALKEVFSEQSLALSELGGIAL
jgi:hypothetical protein